MNADEAMQLLTVGRLVQYAPSMPRGDADDQWFDGIVESTPRLLGETWVVGLCCMEPAYDAATGNRGRTRVAAAECCLHVRLRPNPHHICDDEREEDQVYVGELEKFRCDVIAVLLAIRKKADWIRRLETNGCGPVEQRTATGTGNKTKDLELAQQLSADILAEIARVLP